MMAGFRTGRAIPTLLVCLLPMVVQADYKRDYYTGKLAFEEGDYQKAIQQMNSAIAENPEPAERVKLYGMVFDSYLPYFYLGQAHFRLGNCDAAMQAWQKSQASGIIANLPQAVELKASMGSCAAKVIDSSGVLQLAQQKVGAFEAEIVKLEALQSESLLRPEWAGTWQPKVDSNRGLVNQFNRRLEDARSSGDVAVIESVTREAEQAAGSVVDDVRQARAQIASISQRNSENERVAREAAHRDLQNSIRSARAATLPDGGNEQMSSLHAELNRLISQGEGFAASVSESNLRQQKQNIDNVLRRYNVAVQDWRAQVENIRRQTPPDALKRIAEAYFSGQYERAAQLADVDSVDSDPARIQMLLFRAAANHKLYVRSGMSQEAVLSQVKNDIRSIKRINGRFRPYIAAFSPSFLVLFNETA